MFQTVSNIRGRTRIEPELQASTTDLPRRSTDYPGSNRGSPERRSVAFLRPIRESMTGTLKRSFLDNIESDINVCNLNNVDLTTGTVHLHCLCDVTLLRYEEDPSAAFLFRRYVAILLLIYFLHHNC